MKKYQKGHACRQAGFSLIEVMLAAALFVIFSSGIIFVVLQGFDANRTGSEITIANQYAAEGIEGARSIKNQGFANLLNSLGTGITSSSSGVWKFSGLNNTLSKYTRVITVGNVQRDGSGNIVASGGAVDALTKKITSTVNWNVSGTRNDSVVLSSYFTNWKKIRNGMLVYGDGALLNDTIKYRILDGNTNTWSIAANAADIDSLSSIKALRAAKIYASATRDEKILVSRHYDGASQYIYAQAYNGISWGNVVSLSSWVGNTFLDVQNFDGTYLSNGDFMLVYSDNTTTPKMRTWNGTTWSSAVSLQTLSGIPTYSVVSSRSGTSEVMMAFFMQNSHTATEYFNGGSYATGSWTLHAEHAIAAPANTTRFVDFAWSPNNVLKGGLIFTDSGSDKSMDIKIWTADGSGSGSWSSLVNTTNQLNNIGALSIVGRPGANEFEACDKDSLNPPRIICYKSDFTPVWSNPTNPTIVSGSDTGIQRSYHIGFESSSGDPALIVYSDNTAVPKLKKYTASTNTWDAGGTSISTSPFTLGIVKTVRLIPDQASDHIMILLADASLDVYSVVWDGTNNNLYTTPTGKAFSQHSINGSATTDFWYDFVWDK